MENLDSLNLNNNSNFFYEDTISNADVNEDMKNIYKLIDDENLKEEINDNLKFTNLKDDNYKRYTSINLLKYKILPDNFQNLVNDITTIYNSIDLKQILEADYITLKRIKTILDNAYQKINNLDSMVKLYIEDLSQSNDNKQKLFNRGYFNELDLDYELKTRLIHNYDDSIILGSTISDDIYEELEFQLKRKELLDEICESLNIQVAEDLTFSTDKVLEDLNKLIDAEMFEYGSKINYLEDLMPKGSKYLNDFQTLKNYFNNLFAYDDTDYDSAKKTYELLINHQAFDDSLHNLEELFVNEINDIKKEKEFIFEKVGKKNLEKSIKYIRDNYYEKLGPNSQKIIDYVSSELLKEEYNLEELNKKTEKVVNAIWENTITDAYSFNQNSDFCFLCTNNQFRDPKYQAIMITNKELNKVNEYEDYQIGFICAYNKNILYITENDDIMTVSGNDMSNLKTPLQLEEEFMNFKVCNRIALNGYKTKITAVYIINDGDKTKLSKAIELANTYKLPLIELKKEIQF